MNRFFLVVNVFFAAGIILSGLSVFVNPAKYWVFAFFSLAFPYLLLINLLFIIYWLIQLNRWALLSIVCILLNISHLLAIWQAPRWFPDFSETANRSAERIKILSYNIRALKPEESRGVLLTFPKVLQEIKKRDPDIICFQEFTLQRKGAQSINQILKDLRPAKYYYMFANYSSDVSEGTGLIIFSKYPIMKKQRIDFQNSGNAAMIADVNIKGKFVRIFCVHLQSLQFMKENYDYLDTLGFNYNDQNKKAIKKISVKLRDAFILRANQAEHLAGHINQCPYPLILCGDFNDTPVSYSYRIMKSELKDAFREAGHGLGQTYNGLAPSFRIDYILFSKNFNCTDFETIKINYSDHFPLFAKIYFEEAFEK